MEEIHRLENQDEFVNSLAGHIGSVPFFDYKNFPVVNMQYNRSGLPRYVIIWKNEIQFATGLTAELRLCLNSSEICDSIEV